MRSPVAQRHKEAPGLAAERPMPLMERCGRLAADEVPTRHEDELSIINVMSIQMLKEAAQVQDLSKVVALNLHARDIVRIEVLELCQNLRTLDLSFNLLKTLEGLPTCLPKLRELKLYDNKLVSLHGLAALPALHTLDVSGNRLTSLQGVAGLRELRVLSCARNSGLTSLEGMGKGNALEVLDASGCALPDLTSLSAAVSLRELGVGSNRLRSLRGLQRCDRLMELRASCNELTSLQGLRGCAASLEMLDVRGNRLASTDSLTDGCTALLELYASDNQLTSLAGLAAKALNLETLDVGCNRIQCGQAGGDALHPDVVAALQPFTALEWVYLDDNPGLLPGHRAGLLAALPGLDGVDDLPRRPATGAPDVWGNPADDGPDAEVSQLLPGLAPAALLPTVQEIEAYKAAMNISSQLPTIGLQPRGSWLHQDPEPQGEPGSATTSAAGTAQPSGPSGASSSAPHSSGGAASERPGSRSGRRPSTASGRASRPGSAGGWGGMGQAGVPVRDVMMHQPPPGSRTGGNARIMTPEQYVQAVADFGGTMEAYSASLRSALSSIKSSLQLGVHEAAEQLRAPGGAEARQLPVLPVLPPAPPGLLPTRGKGQGSLPGPHASSGKGPGARSGPLAAKQRAAELAARREALRDPGLPAALQMYQKLYPEPEPAVVPLKPGKQREAAVPDQAAPGKIRRAALPDWGSDDDREEVIRGGDDSEDGSGGSGAEESSGGDNTPVGSGAGSTSRRRDATTDDTHSEDTGSPIRKAKQQVQHGSPFGGGVYGSEGGSPGRVLGGPPSVGASPARPPPSKTTAAAPGALKWRPGQAAAGPDATKKLASPADETASPSPPKAKMSSARVHGAVRAVVKPLARWQHG